MRRHHVLAATALLSTIAPTAAAHAAAPSPKLEKAYQAAYDKADRPGRNILKLGVERPGAESSRACRRDPPKSPGPAPTAPPRRPRRAPGGSVASPALQAIAACESGGDPTAVDASGTYRGKYQFDLQTWPSVGGSGDPAAAPEAEQDRRAAILMSRAGASPWPVCGG